METHTIGVEHSGQCKYPVSEQVIRAVAEQTDTDPLELPPLFELIDPDALDTLFDPIDVRAPLGLDLTFTYAGCEVTVAYDGEVIISVEEAAIHRDRSAQSDRPETK
ncbi:HalOD1 output domain-containing protein [Natronococcus sp.]|uniref:HalOD1 output domain-containing protein n=1 Tax=Natronococcus sp. TaxID=35747 RepID=UPI0025CED51C|nr:HalOD1 output domain-containing protein [Natronococcus sp.]